jgi:hypothetical protein
VSAPPDLLKNWSPSAVTAVRLAELASAHRRSSRSPELSVEPPDLLVGVLLAHPDVDGELRVLLTHFGLTARDVLPPDYPQLSEADLRGAAAMDPASTPPLSEESVRVAELARSSARKDVHLADLLGALLAFSGQELSASLSSAFSGAGFELEAVGESYRRFLAGRSASRPGIVGRDLRDWLVREYPRRPVEVARYASDQPDGEQDLIGIGREADAFAYLIASRELRPPLAVGLFGDWGSGKSFLMRSIQRRIAKLGELVTPERQADAPVWRTVSQIEFNAWEYVQGNLWAGLLERIFRELGSMPQETSLVRARRAPIEADQASTREQVKKLGGSVQKLQRQVETQEQAVKQAEQAVATAADALSRRNVEDETAKKVARDALTRLWGTAPAGDQADLIAALETSRTQLLRGRAVLTPYARNPRNLLLLTLGVALVPAMALVLAALQAPPVVSLLGGLATLVPVLGGALRSGTAWVHDRLTEIETAEAAIRAVAAKPLREAEQKAARTRADLESARRALQEETERWREVVASDDALSRQLAELTPERVLIDFADERSLDYRRRLGLLATVRKDLRTLEEEIQNNNDRRLAVADGAPVDDKTPSRVVLYIDDLDRCPPSKVVEVLEAVHLLLAFRMFVVVVAVDTRWLSSALIQQLSALREGGDHRHPTAQDYLEKIFQVPFWVQPLSDGAQVQLVRGLVAPSVRHRLAGGADGTDPSRPHFAVGNVAEVLEHQLARRGAELRLESGPLALSTDDLELLEKLAPLLGDTPRRVKRFVNMCQLLLAMPPTLADTGPQPTNRAAVCFLAALNEGLPTVADAVFRAAAGGAPGTLWTALDGWPDVCHDERDRLRKWLQEHRTWQAAPLTAFNVRLDLVRRLRFNAPARLTLAMSAEA